MGFWSARERRYEAAGGPEACAPQEQVRLIVEQMKTTRARVLFIANKRWEADPLMGVLLQKEARPQPFPWPEIFWAAPPKSGDPQPPCCPRAVFDFDSFQLEVWCLNDVMNPSVSSSSTLEKARVLDQLMASDKGAPDFVVAVGTASCPDSRTFNGSVFVGAKAFIHDPLSDSDFPGYWHLPAGPGSPRPQNLELEPTVKPGFFSAIDDTLRFQVAARLLRAPNHPAQEAAILSGFTFTSIADINILNYDDYFWADREALAAFEAQTPEGSKDPVASVETTQALIRFKASAPFVFVAGIANETGRFNEEVAPRVYAQNFVAAHNAGVAAAWLIPTIASYLT
jgi:hypothetical protein